MRPILILLLAGCEPGAVSVAPQQEAAIEWLQVESIEWFGTSREPCSIEIDGHADSDGIDDRDWRGAIELDGESAPIDEGGKQTVTAYVTAVQQRDSERMRRRVSVTLYESTE